MPPQERWEKRARVREWAIGIDEAGRGPVLGPLVYAACACPAGCEGTRIPSGVTDSKQLSAAQRETLYGQLRRRPPDQLATWTVVISPQEISAKMLAPRKINLNTISHDAALRLVAQAIDAGYFITEAYVDTVGGAAEYERKFRERFPSLRRVVVQAKADSAFALVSAASIVAKVTRDRQLRAWAMPRGIQDGDAGRACGPAVDWGSGYPSDPDTQQWLARNVHPVFGYPPLVRFSWSTCEERLRRHAVKVTWAVSEGEQLKPAKADSILHFFLRKEQGTSRKRPGWCLRRLGMTRE
ncbi:hypothetical protein CDCA_CDCA13G3580 [Cyanidium caldarium]|uniref:Ribonuclease n=1 Tax=Cyanidium caldarium TaxID=2771 RepID=A0AAV9IZR5_CYACA|nr:hypothetical protein CDCA_CDCA13G3580 [Cyanidium caldarium]